MLGVISYLQDSLAVHDAGGDIVSGQLAVLCGWRGHLHNILIHKRRYGGHSTLLEQALRCNESGRLL